MTNTEVTFIRAVADAIKNGNAQDLSTAVSDFSSFTFKEAPDPSVQECSDDFIDELLELIGSEGFVELTESFQLLMFFQNDWGRLNQVQRVQVCRVLEQEYEKIKDHTSQLVIVELLGDYLCDRSALDALNGLRHVQDETARAHVAHGYGLLVRNTQDPSLKSEAMTSLQEMTRDTSPIVSHDARRVLVRLGAA